MGCARKPHLCPAGPPFITRSAFWSLPALALLGLPFALKSADPAAPPEPAVVFGEILAQNSDSLTDYQADNVSSLSNDLRPRVIQRGVGADGAQLASAAWGMALGGSSGRSNWRGSTSLNGVDLRTGSFAPNERDISLPTDGIAVGVGRSYNGQQWDEFGARRDSAGLQGNNWAQAGFPEVLLVGDNSSKLATDIVYLAFGADRFVEFKRYDATSTEFQGRQGTAGYVAFTGASGSDPEYYVYTDRRGTTWTFFGYDTNAGNAAGQFWKAEDADGNVTYAEHETNAATAAGGFDASGGPSEVFDPSGRRFTYTYASGRLTGVKAETKTGGTWASPSGLVTVGEVDYDYYPGDPDEEDHGLEGDLKSVVRSTRLSDSTHVSTQYYRYWKSGETESGGNDHLVKLVLSAEGVRQYDLLDNTFDDDHLAATDAALAEYASHSFEYDSSGRISSAIYNGECGCSGGTIGQYNFTYELNPGYSDSPGYTLGNWQLRSTPVMHSRPARSLL